MKRVFQSDITIRFSGGVINQNIDPVFLFDDPREFSFLSAEGIKGVIELSRIERVSENEISCRLFMMTEQKRMLPDFESYLNFIQTVISEQCKTSISAFRNIRNTSLRTPSYLVEVEKVGAYVISRDLDGEFYLLNPEATQKVIQVFERHADAVKEAQARL